MKHHKILIITTLSWFAADQLTKAWAESAYFQPWVFVPDWFYLAVHQNSGIAFGITLAPLLQILTSIALIGLLIALALRVDKHDSKNRFLNQFLFGIIIGGGLGNFVSRMRLGYVTDFLVLWPIPTFNIADIGITVGLIGLMFVAQSLPQADEKSPLK